MVSKERDHVPTQISNLYLILSKNISFLAYLVLFICTYSAYTTGLSKNPTYVLPTVWNYFFQFDLILFCFPNLNQHHLIPGF